MVTLPASSNISSPPTILTLLKPSDGCSLEAQPWQTGQYNRIPQLLAHFEENQEFYLVQEFIPGHTLSAELQPGHCWHESQVIQLLQEVWVSWNLFTYGLIHRDVKPSNLIRRQQDGRLFLIDFARSTKPGRKW